MGASLSSSAFGKRPLVKMLATAGRLNHGVSGGRANLSGPQMVKTGVVAGGTGTQGKETTKMKRTLWTPDISPVQVQHKYKLSETIPKFQ